MREFVQILLNIYFSETNIFKDDYKVSSSQRSVTVLFVPTMCYIMQ